MYGKGCLENQMDQSKELLAHRRFNLEGKCLLTESAAPAHTKSLPCSVNK